MPKRLLDAGSIGSILTSWKRHVHAENNFIVFLHWLNERSIVVKNAFINIVKFLFGIKDLKVFTYRLHRSLKRDTKLGIKVLLMNKQMGGKGIKLDTMEYMIGSKESWVNLKNVNIVKAQIRRSIIGLIKVTNTKEIYQTGSVFA